MKIYDNRISMINDLVKKDSKILEIGVFKGEFAEILLCTNPRILYLVDCWENSNICSGNADGNNVENYNGVSLYNFVKDKFCEFSNIDIIRNYSQNFIPLIDDNTLDIVYIDGDHSYQGVKQDLESVYPKVKKGGYIMGHDYEMNMNKAQHYYDFGVKKAVDEFCKKYNLNIFAKAMDGCVSFCIIKTL